MSSNNTFAKIAQKSTTSIGSVKAFIITTLSIIVWLVIGPFVHFSDTWQITINTISTLTTSIIVVLIQYTQNRDNTALHLKIDELIRSVDKANNQYQKIEQLSEEELEEMKQKNNE